MALTGLRSEAGLGGCGDYHDCGYYSFQGSISTLLPTHHHTHCYEKPPNSSGHTTFHSLHRHKGSNFPSLPWIQTVSSSYAMGLRWNARATIPVTMQLMPNVTMYVLLATLSPPHVVPGLQFLTDGLHYGQRLGCITGLEGQ